MVKGVQSIEGFLVEAARHYPYSGPYRPVWMHSAQRALAKQSILLVDQSTAE